MKVEALLYLYSHTHSGAKRTIEVFILSCGHVHEHAHYGLLSSSVYMGVRARVCLPEDLYAAFERSH